MTSGEEWPVEFSFHPAEEETSKETDTLNCILCDLDHPSNECPNTVQVCKYCGGIGHPPEGIKHHRQVCCFCGINHSVLTECQIKWYEPFSDDLTKEECTSFSQEITQEMEEGSLNPLLACWYCGGVGRNGEERHLADCERPLPMCRYCGMYHSEVPECWLKWQEDFPDDFTIQTGEYDSFYQEVEIEDQLCQLCKGRPVIINEMCNYCNNLIKNKDEGEVLSPGFNQTHEIGEPSNWPAPLHDAEDCSEVRYENFYWQSPSPVEMLNHSDNESVGSCDWTVIPSDEE